MYFKNQKFLVAGLSRSGKDSAEFLLKRGAQVYLYDDVVGDTVRRNVEELELKGAKYVHPSVLDDVINECDVLVLSPGIPIDNRLPVSFRKAGKNIIGEEELASLYLRATAVAVTGTNGKTTTVSMIDRVINACKIKSVACGNVGNPLINEVDNLTYDDVAVVEISSFQLETLSSLKPHVAVITNVTEDHLNRHYNMENYIFLKSKLLRFLRESEFAVLNYDDPITKSMASKTKGRIKYFSVKEKVDGAYFKDGAIWVDDYEYIKVDEMLVSGIHNVYDALACVVVAEILGLDRLTVRNALATFKGVKFRLETIATVDGVTYINDSKATNVDATCVAISNVKQETILLLGGKDKGYDYCALFKRIADSSVVHVILYGENRFKLMDGAKSVGYENFSTCQNFYYAVEFAKMIAKSGQTVLFSPASSSFDEFSNYEERGEAFNALVVKPNENKIA